MAEILVKKLSPNDTSNSIHQAGIYVSKEDKVLSFFPPLDETGKNPRVELLFTDDEGNEWTFNYIHYNNKIRSGGTRDEYRLTGMTSFIKKFNLTEGSYIFIWNGKNNYRVSCDIPDDMDGNELPLDGWKTINLDRDELLLENSEEIEIVASDEEYIEEPELWNISNKKQLSAEEVRVIKKDYSVYELFRKNKKRPQKLYLDVSFQRNSVWSIRQQNELIESVLLGLPLPIFYFKQENDASLSVIDGKQRLTALFSFLDDGFKLKGLKILSFLNGKKFSELTGEYTIYQTQIEDYQLYSHVILPPTPDRYIFEIFGRVNRAGTKLNKQEIRNAMYRGNGMEMIHRVANSPAFNNATGINAKKDKRMKSAYMITRFISFYFLYKNQLMTDDGEKRVPYVYEGNMDELVEKSLRRLNALPQEKLNNIENTINKALVFSYEEMGNKSFRRLAYGKNPLNQILFEIQMYCIVDAIDNNYIDDKKSISNGIITASKDTRFNEFLDRGRDNRSDVNNRFSRFMEVYTKNRNKK